MPERPTGAVTFLFTDIEGSTRLWEQRPAAKRDALAPHDLLLRTTIETQGGYVVKTVGDAFCAAFASARDATRAALAALRAEGQTDGLKQSCRRANLCHHHSTKRTRPPGNGWRPLSAA